MVRTQAAQEERAQRHCQQQGYETLLPLARVERRQSNGLLVARVRALFSRYLFVGVNSQTQRWQPLASTIGVAGFVGYTPGQLKPLTVLQDDINNLKERISAEPDGMFQMGLSRPQDIHPGMLVRVLFGPFRDRVAIVKADHGARVAVLLDAAGWNTRLPKELLTAA